MRVICLGRFCDDLPGGIEAHVVSLLETLQDRVDFVHLVPSRDGKSARFVKGGVPVVRTASWNVDGSLALSPGLILETWRQYRQQGCDLVHLHFPGPMSHLASMVIPAHVPRVITWHADITRQRRLLKLYEPWQRAILRQARAIIVATPEHLKSSAALSIAGIRQKVRVIPYGFELSRFVAPQAEAARIRQSHPGRLIFAVGRHVHYKGFSVLLEALQKLAPDVQLILGG
ncbi:MAG: glycosyltransferase, partial [Azovibrio sp.]|uniref:glycosyltransferase n=1 Tax=Azovibrio sp. TaxID=1872673 RepID=UPI003C74A002